MPTPPTTDILLIGPYHHQNVATFSGCYCDHKDARHAKVAGSIVAFRSVDLQDILRAYFGYQILTASIETYDTKEIAGTSLFFGVLSGLSSIDTSRLRMCSL